MNDVTRGVNSALTNVSRKIEDQYNGELRDELVRLGYEDTSARIFRAQGANKPDGAWTFKSKDGRESLAIFSGKMGTRRQAVNAISTAGQYRWNLQPLVPVAEAFGVTYPETQRESFGLYALESQWHPFESYLEDSISGIAERIYQILTEAPRASEASEPMMIRLLRSSVEQLAGAFARASASVLINELGENSPLVSSLRMPSKVSPLSEAQARKSAAYVLINQLLFYYILSSHEELGLPKIDPTKVTPGTIHPGYFARVLEIDYRPVFEYDFAKHLESSNGTRAIRSVLHALDQVKASEISNDVIGKVFHNLIPLEQRKPLGAYYTNSNAAALLAEVTVNGAFDSVMDPACGSGTMLVAAYQRKADLYAQGGRRPNETVHGQFVGQQLTGIDIMPFSAHLATVNLSLRAPRFKLELVRAAISDSLQLRPGKAVESARAVFRRVAWSGMTRLESFDTEIPPEVEEGAVRGEFEVTRVDVVLMNPPFSDSERIPADYKIGLEDRFGAGPTAGLLHGKYSFQLPFLLLADEFLLPGGRLGAVLPLTTLTGESFQPWLRWFLRNYQVRAVVVGFGRAAFSENTALAECLLVAEKTTPRPTSPASTVILGVEKSPPDWDASLIRQLAEVIRHPKTVRVHDVCSSMVVYQAQLDPREAGIQKLVQGLRPDWEAVSRIMAEVIRPTTTTFSELMKSCAIDFSVEPLSTREQAGPHGRGREYYCLEALTFFASEAHTLRKDDRFALEQRTKTGWVARDRHTGETFELPGNPLIPACRRIVGVSRIDAADGLDFVVGAWFPALGRLIERVVQSSGAYSEPERARERFKKRIQSKWPARIAEGRTRAWMARKLDLAGPGTRLVAAYSHENPMILGNHWMIKAPEGQEWMERALVLWFNSTFFIADLLSARTQTAGSWSRIDKHRLTGISVPQLGSWSDVTRSKMEDRFKAVASDSFPSLLSQLETGFHSRKAIDDFFLSVLRPELTTAERHALLADLSLGVFSYLTAMKSTISHKRE